MLKSIVRSFNESKEDEEDLERADAVAAGDPRELKQDTLRGRPDVDLRGWAERRGLSFRGGSPQAGFALVTCPWSEDLLFNVVRGRWPSGAYGVLCHEVRLYDVSARGSFHAVRTIGSGWKALNPLQGGEAYFKVPFTSAGVRVPHVATVTGLHVARRAEQYTDRGGSWRTRPLDDLDLQDHWIASVRAHSDERTVERLLSGPIRRILETAQGLGFQLRIEYGQVVVSRQDFLNRDEDLDGLVASTVALAEAVREICVPEVGPVSLDTRIPTPEWLASVQSHPGEPHMLMPIGARLDTVAAIAAERGMALEDPRSFSKTFPALNIPGEPFAVLHGRLPGTTLSGRLLCCAERPLHIPDDFLRILTDPGGRVGCDVAVIAVSGRVPATTPEGEVEGDLRIAIADGVLTAWRPRPRWQADGPALDRLAADLAALATRRGLAV